MVSSCNVWAITKAGKIDLSDAVLSWSYQESMEGLPNASIKLPLHRNVSATSRVPYIEVFEIGDLIFIEALGFFGNEKWEGVLSGVIDNIENPEDIEDNAYTTSTLLSCSSFAKLLTHDSVAWWMFLSTTKSWSLIRTQFTADMKVSRPDEVAFEYMRRIVYGYSGWSLHGFEVEDVLHVGFSALRAVANYQQSLGLLEGAHYQTLKSFTDAPIHEMYVTHLSRADVNGSSLITAKKPQLEDKTSTAIVMRPAPYPYMDENGRGNVSEWQALKLHRLEPQHVLGKIQGGYSEAAVKNFVIVYPNFEFLRDNALLSLGVMTKNTNSIKRFGLRDLKISSRLIINEEKKTNDDIQKFMRTLTNRIAGQWNRQDKMYVGQIQIAFLPQIRIGERVELPSPWHEGENYQFHVKARSLSWNPTDGGTGTLTLERGLPSKVYDDAAWFVSGLEKVDARHWIADVNATGAK